LQSTHWFNVFRQYVNQIDKLWDHSNIYFRNNTEFHALTHWTLFYPMPNLIRAVIKCTSVWLTQTVRQAAYSRVSCSCLHTRGRTVPHPRPTAPGSSSSSPFPAPRDRQGTSGAATSQERKPAPRPRSDDQQQPPAADNQGARPRSDRPRPDLPPLFDPVIPVSNLSRFSVAGSVQETQRLLSEPGAGAQFSMDPGMVFLLFFVTWIFGFQSLQWFWFGCSFVQRRGSARRRRRRTCATSTSWS
jgi:hypothetical protein